MERAWAPQDTEYLVSHWQSNSASQIADALSEPRTRCAVCGKVNRLVRAGVLQREPRRKKYVVDPRAQMKRTARVSAERIKPPPQQRVREMPAAAPADANGCQLIEIGEHGCHFPLDLGLETPIAGALFCNAPAFESLPYCLHHAQRAYSGRPVHER